MRSDWVTIPVKKDLKKEIESLLEKEKNIHPFSPNLPDNPAQFFDSAAKEKLQKMLKELENS